IYNEGNQKRITELQAKFETEKKEKEILQLRSEKQKTKQNSILIIIISTTIALLIILVLLYNRFLIKKKSIQLLDNKNIQLEKANKELITAKEKAEESDRLKTAFLANISHEIRTPMNAIIGFSEFLVDPGISDEQKLELLRFINLNSDILLNLIDDILDISLIESGQLKIKKEKISINRLLEETYQLMNNKKELKESNVKLKYISTVNGEIEVKSDPFRLKQILINLIDNSIKFTTKGEIKFGYKVIQLKNGKKIQFNVNDTGIGIDQKYHESIFEMFYKVPTDNTVLYRGTGVGLSIVKSLIEQMGGEIWLNSSLNTGSTFYFTIPYD
ncbi:sensor histidine kinase, partial [Bacteroidota bacterium]